MSVDPWTIALEVANFLVLVWLLERLLYRPVLGVVAARRAEVDRLREADEAARRELAEQRAAMDAERQGLIDERARVLEDAHVSAGEERRRLEAQGREEVQRLLADGRARLAHERAEAGRELRRKSVDLGLGIARRLLETSIPGDGDEVFVDAVCLHLRAMDPSERERLAAGLGSGPAVKVITARALAPDRQAECRQRLGDALGRAADMSFTVDPSLLAGVEVYVGGLVLRHSWRDALADTEATLLDGVERGEKADATDPG